MEICVIGIAGREDRLIEHNLKYSYLISGRSAVYWEEGQSKDKLWIILIDLDCKKKKKKTRKTYLGDS